MGCGYPPKTLEKELEINDEENEKLNYKENQMNKDISFILHQKLEKFIKINPFYNISLSEFEETINAIKNNNNNEIIDKIISTFFKNEKSFVKSLFIKTVECAIKKYDLNLNTENINNDLIVLIIVFIYILLTDNKRGKRDLFRKNILLFCCNSIVVGKLLKFINLLNSLSFIPPSTQKINNELDKNNKDNKCLFELLILANNTDAPEFSFLKLLV